MKHMKKSIATILTTALIAAIVVTPSYKVNSPSFSGGFTVSGNKPYNGNITVH